MISIQILKLCGYSVLPLLQFLNPVLKVAHFPQNGKNVVLLHRKGDKLSLKNYRSIPLLPICRKRFERLIYNKISEYFMERDLFNLS